MKENIKQRATCPACEKGYIYWNKNSQDHSCSFCGKKYTKTETEKIRNKKHIDCAHCAAIENAGEKYCRNCGRERI